MASTQPQTETQTIRQHLHRNNIAPHDVADFLDITPAEAMELISGHTPWPLDLLYRLAVHTGLTPESIFADA